MRLHTDDCAVGRISRDAETAVEASAVLAVEWSIPRYRHSLAAIQRGRRSTGANVVDWRQEHTILAPYQ
jgi:hypothetical protein